MEITLNLDALEYQELKDTFKDAYKWVCKNNNYQVTEELPKYLQDEVMRLTEHWFKERCK